MRHVLLLLIVGCLISSGTAQIQVGVWTDRPVYRYGDTVTIAVTGFNPTADTIHLSFPTSSQANYILDDYDFFAHNGGWHVVTYATIPPLSSTSWDYLRYPRKNSDLPPLTVGIHALIGEVLGYGKSDTLHVIVAAPTSVKEDSSTGEAFLLGRNYPNPFNGVTWVPFTLNTGSRVKMDLFDALGRQIRTILDQQHRPGSHLARIEIGDMPSGSYWCRIEVEGRTQTLRVALIK